MNRNNIYKGTGAIVALGILFGAVYFFAPRARYAYAILECYRKSPIPNNSVQHVRETSSLFINLPKDLYPKDILHSWTTVEGKATAFYVSNGGLPGEGLDATPECWSTYVEFEWPGEVDLRVKSTVEGVPDYFVRFIVSPA